MTFTKNAARDSGEATKAAARKILVLLELFRTRAVRFSTYERVHGLDYRSFQRDLQHLRKIGEEAGFKISAISGRERAELVNVDSELRSLDASPRVLALISALRGALGAPVSSELGGLGEGSADTGFLRFILPQLVEQTRVAETYERLKAAWEARPGPAVVKFEYDPGSGARTVRRVEPYRLLLRSGTAYLVGYDLERRGWRTFALDRFSSLPERAGTIQQLRLVPKQYESTDTIGFFKAGGELVAVTVELTPRVAASATSRRWQTAQRVEQCADGSARITFEVTDISEVVRWSLGFGKEAKIIAPSEAVEVAVRTVAEIALGYGR